MERLEKVPRTKFLYPPTFRNWEDEENWKNSGKQRRRKSGKYDPWKAKWKRHFKDSGNWLWTGRPGMLRFMGSQRVGHD